MADITREQKEQKEQIPNPPTLGQSLARLNKEQLGLLSKHRAFSTFLVRHKEPDVTADSSAAGDQSGNRPLFEFPEHEWLGQQLTLKGHDTASAGTDANSNPFTFPNGLTLTQGQINGLAGDFFAIALHICIGTSDDDRRSRFQAAYKTLAEGDLTRANNLLVILEAQTVAFNDARQGKGGKTLKEITSSRTHASHSYDTGHAWALDVAKAGDLTKAYTIDAFAEHFLEDSFAAGHLRVPGDYMYDSFAKNVCVNAMHNEDNLTGLVEHSAVPDPNTTWNVIGDTMPFEDNGKDIGLRCLFALQASADEVYDAITNHTIPAKEE